MILEKKVSPLLDNKLSFSLINVSYFQQAPLVQIYFNLARRPTDFQSLKKNQHRLNYIRQTFSYKYFRYINILMKIITNKQKNEMADFHSSILFVDHQFQLQFYRETKNNFLGDSDRLSRNYTFHKNVFGNVCNNDIAQLLCPLLLL